MALRTALSASSCGPMNITDPIELLVIAAHREGGMDKIAAKLGVTPAYLSMIKNGRKPLSNKILDYLGLRRVMTVQSTESRSPAIVASDGVTAPAGHAGVPVAGDAGPAKEVNLGRVTVTCNEDGDCVAVTRTDDEHRILSVIWERFPPPNHGSSDA